MSITKKNYENVIKLIMLGILKAYGEKIINFDDMHFSLFSPKGEYLMKKEKLHDIARFISIGMELEDIYNLCGKEKHDMQLSNLENEIMKSIYFDNQSDCKDRDEIFLILKSLCTSMD